MIICTCPVPRVVVLEDDLTSVVLDLLVSGHSIGEFTGSDEFGEFLFETAPAVAVAGHLIDLAICKVVVGVLGCGGTVCQTSRGRRSRFVVFVE